MIRKKYRFILIGGLIASMLFFGTVYLRAHHWPLLKREEDRGLMDQLHGYTSGVSRAVVNIYLKRNIMIDGPDRNEPTIAFNSPLQFQYLKDTSTAVFHPDGGGGNYKAIHPSNMENGKEGYFVYNKNFIIEGSLDEKDPEIIAFLSGITKEKCLRVNKDINLSKIYRLKSDQSNLYKQNSIIEGVVIEDLGPPHYLDHPKLRAQTVGCFRSNDKKEYVYYSRIIPR